MIIEFIGLPGSGKTYLTNLLCKDPDFCKAQNPKITVRYCLRSILAVLSSKILLNYFFSILLSKNDVRRKLKRFKSLIYLNAYTHNYSKIIIYDQHIIQNLITFQKVLNLKLDSNELLRVMNFFNLPKNIVFVYNFVDLDIVSSRFKLRKNSNLHNKTLLDNMTVEEFFDEIKELSNIIEETIQLLINLGQIVIVYDNKSNDITSLKTRILNHSKF